MITVVIKITYIQDHYEILTFFLPFAGGDWATLGPLKLSRIDPVCSYDGCGIFPWSHGRSAVAHTLLVLMLGLKDTREHHTGWSKSAAGS